MRRRCDHCVRVAVVLLIAAPAFAHGEQLVFGCGLIFYVLPALALLLVPWHDWWARFLTVLCLAIGAVVLWAAILPKMLTQVGMSPALEWVILLSPTLLALVLAIVLRAAVRRRMA
jgi:hypothetical protein